jgi:hypothetical protein
LQAMLGADQDGWQAKHAVRRRAFVKDCGPRPD